MAEVREYSPGTPCWAELATPDLEASRAFYSELFGWAAYTISTDRFGDYEILALGDIQGPMVGGITELADESERPSWTCYFAVDDVDATVEAARSAGGQVYMEGTDMGDTGRTAMLAGPEGAEFSLWQAYEMAGAEAAGVPGTMCWVELACRDTEKALRFYNKIFGWEPVTRIYDHTAYTDWHLRGRPVCGMIHMGDRWPAHYPAHWIPHFAVADCDASAAKATALGAHIQLPPRDTDRGRFAMLTDPGGARLAILTPKE
ncbi:VOC family protein [Actinocorallia aurantiaca]|uniref:VOC family protein n=1 Tax=Actinocorallia aurantiaca TaxID=46204 RepID=A0ABN3UVF7_9ACTN